ncbi:MAG TPA: hypothetical protein VID47_03420 [Actinomycetota bacterium]|jgi:hypothetical protein
MDWLFTGIVVIILAAYALPPRLARGRARSSIEEFNHHMGILEQTEKAGGRWIVAPRKGEAFVGRRERARSRARARRRRVFTVLLEALALTLLIGMFPPLRGMWFLSAAVAVLLGAYVMMLLRVKRNEEASPLPVRAGPNGLDVPLGPATPRPDRPMGWLQESDIVHVRLRSPAELEAAGV